MLIALPSSTCSPGKVLASLDQSSVNNLSMSETNKFHLVLIHGYTH